MIKLRIVKASSEWNEVKAYIECLRQDGRIEEFEAFTGEAWSTEYEDFAGRSLDKWPGKESLRIMGIKARNDFEQLHKYRLKDIPENVIIDDIDLRIILNSFHFSIELCNDSIGFRLWCGHDDWPYKWSTKAFIDEVENLLESGEFSLFCGSKKDFQVEYSAIYLIHKTNAQKTIKELDEYCYPEALRLLDQVVKKLEGEYPFKAVLEFPESIKYECEQYLSYFGKFLCDIGIESDTKLHREGKRILFSVLPKDQNEAIEKVSQAFSLFMAMPAIYDENVVCYPARIEEQIKYQRLEASVEHFKSQLRLANATIIAQQDHIHSLKKISETVMSESIVKIVENEREIEGMDLLGGMIKLKKYKKNGVEINFPLAFEKNKKDCL